MCCVSSRSTLCLAALPTGVLYFSSSTSFALNHCLALCLYGWMDKVLHGTAIHSVSRLVVSLFSHAVAFYIVVIFPFLWVGWPHLGGGAPPHCLRTVHVTTHSSPKKVLVWSGLWPFLIMLLLLTTSLNTPSMLTEESLWEPIAS